MHSRAANPPSKSPEAGFSLTELLIASTAFTVIMTSAVAMLVNWQKMSGRSEADINATAMGAKALAQIANDIRVSTYLFHYASMSIIDNTLTANYSALGTGIYKNVNFASAKRIDLTFPIVTQGTTLDGPGGTTLNNTTFFAGHGNMDTSMIGETSTGSIPFLAMISDQPDGIQRPRYIAYWTGASTTPIKVKTGSGISSSFYNVPLYRMEATPSSNTVDSTPRCWYSTQDTIAAASATSSITFTVNNPGPSTIAINTGGVILTSNVNASITKVADIVVGGGLSHTFSLRNPHPYSNLSLISPFAATISLRTSRAYGGLKNMNDIYQMDTSAFARNVPLPQLTK